MILQKGPSSRRRGTEKRYIESQRKSKPGGCVFCQLADNDTSQIISTYQHCMVIKNLFGYDVWDDHGVEEHLMIIPKRHVDSLADLSKEELADYMKILIKYEKLGYSIYARSPGNITKSVVHQHTHLIKIDNKRKTFKIYLRRPHILWMR